MSDKNIFDEIGFDEVKLDDDDEFFKKEVEDRSVEDVLSELEAQHRSKTTTKVDPDSKRIQDDDEFDPDDDLEFISDTSVKSGRIEGRSLNDYYDVEDDDDDYYYHRTSSRRKGPFVLLIIAIIIVVLAVFWMFFGRTTSWGQSFENQVRSILHLDSAASTSDDYETDAIPEVNALIEAYFDSYADGDVSKIEEYAYPISETEQSYISMYSKFIESYNNIHCYTTAGVDRDSYIVIATADVKYVDVETTAPTLSTFYVSKSAGGDLYIQNEYSPFNTMNRENDQDQDILDRMTTFTASDGVNALQNDIQNKYSKAVYSDEALKTLMEETIPDAQSTWVGQIGVGNYGDIPEADEEDTESDVDADEDDATDEVEGDFELTDADDTVYATASIRVRSIPGTDGEVLTYVEPGTALERIGITDNGWSRVRVEDDDVTGYVSNDYISTERP